MQWEESGHAGLFFLPESEFLLKNSNYSSCSWEAIMGYINILAFSNIYLKIYLENNSISTYLCFLKILFYKVCEASITLIYSCVCTCVYCVHPHISLVILLLAQNCSEISM